LQLGDAILYFSSFLERTPLERCCVHNMSPFVSSSGLSPGSREAKVQRTEISKTVDLNDRDFIVRKLYKDSY